MGKARYVEATADGYYGGKRVVGKKFWLADGGKEFSKKWMKDADPSSADPAPAPSAAEANAEHDEQVAELTKAAETAVEERDAAEAKVEGAEKERDDAKADADAAKEIQKDLGDCLKAAEKSVADLTAERDKLKAELEEATKLTPKPAEKPSGSSDKGGSGAKA